MAELDARYEVRYDTAVSRRMYAAGMRRYWAAWLWYGVRNGCGLAVLGAAGWLFTSYYVDRYSGAGLVAVVVFCLACGMLAPLLTYVQIVDRREKDSQAGEVWQCRMTEEGWSFQNKEGVLRFIPWKLMKLEYEHDDGWLVWYGGEQVWVFRAPLREAGLEEEFRGRIGKGEPTTFTTPSPQ